MYYLVLNYTANEAVTVHAANPESALNSPVMPDGFPVDEDHDIVVYQLAEDDAGTPVKYHADELRDQDWE